jgi:UDP-glucose:(heptosyl)LPS alpha-1,3-glucosyltransferase
MKIALVTKRFSKTWGGAEMVAFYLAKGLTELSHTVDIYTAHADLDLPGCSIHQVSQKKIFSFLNPIIFRKRVIKKLEKADIDIVYSLCRMYPADVYRLSDGIHRHWMKVQYPSLFKRGIKYSTSLIHPVVVRLEHNIFGKDNCKRYITNSEMMKNQLIEFYGVHADLITVIYNGVDMERFNLATEDFREAMRNRLGFKRDDRIILFVSNNFVRKGLTTLIESLASVKDEKVKLLVIGRGKTHQYRALASKSGLKSDSIFFAGHSDAVHRFYGMADIFALPTMYEPFANVCLEAMACGLPVITTEENGASELVQNGRNGFVIDRWDDVQGLSACIKTLMQGDAFRHMGKDAHETARKYTWERHIRETVEVFDSLSNSQRD